MIRPATFEDLDRILAINLEWEHFLSPLDAAALERLHQQSAYHRVFQVDSGVAGFLLVLREGADYQSPNYLWHASRSQRFLYVDRIAVSGVLPRRGIGAALYDDLIQFARESGIDTITCEFNLVPRNLASERFHHRLGFEEVGSQWLEKGKKRVSLQRLQLSPERMSP
jgi:predicted GNAT superfamily acetyltransferase